MAITATQAASTQVQNRVIGRYLDSAGTPAAATITIGFSPRYFAWVNLTDRIKWEWFEGMAAGTTLKTAANGDTTLDTSDVAISPDAATGNQYVSQGSPDTTNAGVVNNVSYPGPSTIINSTATQIPGIKSDDKVVIAAAVIAQNKQYEWVAY